MWMVWLLGFLLFTGPASAEPGFSEKYERNYNIFNPTNQYRPDNPLNPTQTYAPNNPFNPSRRPVPGLKAAPPEPVNLRGLGRAYIDQ